MTKSIKATVEETNRRRQIQMAYNEANGITPKTIIKEIRELIEIGASPSKTEKDAIKEAKKLSPAEKASLVEKLTAQMKEAAKNLDFERAAYLRDRIAELRTKK